MPLFAINNPASYQQAASQLGISGKNPFNTLLRMAGLVYGGQVLDQLNLGSALAPDRNNWLRYGLNLASPGGSQARLDALSQQIRSQARQAGSVAQRDARQRGDASGSALAQGLALDGERAIQSAIRNESLPETQMARVGQTLGLMESAMEPQGLSLLASLAGQLDSIVGRQLARQRSNNGFSGLLQSAAQLYGMGAFGGRRFTPGIFGG